MAVNACGLLIDCLVFRGTREELTTWLFEAPMSVMLDL